MNATLLIQTLYDRDFTLQVEDGKLRVIGPRDELTDELQQAIRQYRVDAMALLSMPKNGSAPAWRSVKSPCPNCHKPQRLFVRGSPDIEGEPDQDVLICGRCGTTKPACPECWRSNLAADADDL
jgi:hypothetical protein